MKHIILGRDYSIRFVSRLKNRGDCSSPTHPNRTIRVLANLRGEERLEVLIHEMLHAAGWHISEEFVTQFAKDAARALTQLGYEGTK